MKLFCLDDHGKPQLLDEVEITPPISSLSSPEAELVIVSYSKDETIINESRTLTTFTIIGQHDKKLTDFGKYLQQRKKAGIAEIAFEKYYILPYREGVDGSKSLRLITISNSSAPVASPPVPASAQPLEASKAPTASVSTPSSSSSSSISRTSVATNAATATASASVSTSNTSSTPATTPAVSATKKKLTAPPPLSMMASLLAKIDTTTKLLTSAASAPVNIIARVDVVDRMTTVENQLKEKLRVFESDPDFHCLRLEPMDKDERYVVHDVVTMYPDLLSVGVGDNEERHVVVYRKGHQPPDVEVYNPHRVAAPRRPKAKSSSASIAALASAPAPDNLVAINQVKRDRRSVAEVQEEIKRKKLGV